MSILFWLVPTVVAVVLLIPAIVAGLRAGDEARALGRALSDLNGLRPAVVDARSEAAALREQLLRLRSR